MAAKATRFYFRGKGKQVSLIRSHSCRDPTASSITPAQYNAFVSAFVSTFSIAAPQAKPHSFLGSLAASPHCPKQTVSAFLALPGAWTGD